MGKGEEVSEIELTPANRQLIIENVDWAIGQGGLVVKFGKATNKRKLEQNKKIHAMLADISRQVEWFNNKFTVEQWKRLTMASWLREEDSRPDMIPALDGNGIDVIYEHTSQLTIKRMASFIEWVYAFGAEHDVIWSEKSERT